MSLDASSPRVPVCRRDDRYYNTKFKANVQLDAEMARLSHSIDRLAAAPVVLQTTKDDALKSLAQNQGKIDEHKAALSGTRCYHSNSAFAQIRTRPASSSTRPSAGEALRAAGAGQAVASAGHRAKKNEREAQCERCRSFLKEAVKGYSGELAGFPLLFRSGPSGQRLHER